MLEGKGGAKLRSASNLLSMADSLQLSEALGASVGYETLPLDSCLKQICTILHCG